MKAGAYASQAELAKLEAERERLQAAIAQPGKTTDATLTEILQLVERYRRMAAELRQALDRHRPETARRTLAEALGEVTLVKEPDGAVCAELMRPRLPVADRSRWRCLSEW